jgi:hypothetical protein
LAAGQSRGKRNTGRFCGLFDFITFAASGP